MNKKLLILLLSICTIAFWSSCVDDDDDYVIDEEWKAYQDDLVAKVAANSSGITIFLQIQIMAIST